MPAPSPAEHGSAQDAREGSGKRSAKSGRCKAGQKPAFSIDIRNNGSRIKRRNLLKSRLWARFADLLERLEDVVEPERRGCLATIIHSSWFENMSCAVIVVNCGFVAYDADWSMKHVSGASPRFMALVENAFLAYYAVEILLRILVHRLYFFVNDECKWNLFDFVLVIISMWDIVMSLIVSSLQGNGHNGNISFMRIFRLMKVAKILRTLRVMRVFKDLAVILESFKNSFAALFWCFVMLAFKLYVFSLIFLQGMTSVLEDRPESLEPEEYQAIITSFGSLADTMLTLYMAVTGGDDWGNAYAIISTGGMFYSSLFIFFTFFFVFAVFNILTGVFVEKAVCAATPDMEARIMEYRKATQSCAAEVRHVCEALDKNGSGLISRGEFIASLDNEFFAAYLAAIGLDITDAQLFFDMLTEVDGSTRDEVRIEQFVSGCLNMRGTASSFDMQRALYESADIRRQFHTINARLDATVDRLTTEFVAKSDEVNGLVRDMLDCMRQKGAGGVQASASPCVALEKVHSDEVLKHVPQHRKINVVQEPPAAENISANVVVDVEAGGAKQAVIHGGQPLQGQRQQRFTLGEQERELKVLWREWGRELVVELAPQLACGVLEHLCASQALRTISGTAPHGHFGPECVSAVGAPSSPSLPASLPHLDAQLHCSHSYQEAHAPCLGGELASRRADHDESPSPGKTMTMGDDAVAQRQEPTLACEEVFLDFEAKEKAPSVGHHAGCAATGDMASHEPTDVLLATLVSKGSPFLAQDSEPAPELTGGLDGTISSRVSDHDAALPPHEQSPKDSEDASMPPLGEPGATMAPCGGESDH